MCLTSRFLRAARVAQALLAALHYADDGGWHRLRPRGRAASGLAPSLLPFSPAEAQAAVSDLSRTGLARFLDPSDGPLPPTNHSL